MPVVKVAEVQTHKDLWTVGLTDTHMAKSQQLCWQFAAIIQQHIPSFRSFRNLSRPSCHRTTISQEPMFMSAAKLLFSVFRSLFLQLFLLCREDFRNP